MSKIGVRVPRPVTYYLSEEFKKLCKELLFLVRENGISEIKPDLDNKEELREFFKHVHDGWKQAQSTIIERALKNLSAIDELNAEIKEANRANDKPKAADIKKLKRSLEVENIVMRRMVDSIVWNILQGEFSTIRRLSVNGGEHNFSTANIADALPVIENHNKRDDVIAICSDLTTFVHVGDVLLYSPLVGQTIFLELKSGEKNLELCGLAKFSIEAKCDRFEKNVKADLTDKEHKQYFRIKKQLKTGFQTVSTFNNEKGIDNKSGKAITITPTQIDQHSYAHAIVECWKELVGGKGWAIKEVNECLYIGAYTVDVEKAYNAFYGWMKGIGCDSKVYNILNSFWIPHATPFGALNLPTKLLKQLISGEVSLLLCLDVEKFVDLVNKNHGKILRIATRKETAEANKSSYDVMQTNKNGVISYKGGFIGQGMIDRIVFNFLYPAKAAGMLKELVDRWDEVMPSDDNDNSCKQPAE